MHASVSKNRKCNTTINDSVPLLNLVQVNINISNYTEKDLCFWLDTIYWAVWNFSFATHIPQYCTLINKSQVKVV